MLAVYDRTLHWVLRYRRLTHRRRCPTFVLTAYCYRHHPQGLHPHRGHRPDLRLHRGRPGHLLRGDGRAPAGGGRHRGQDPARGAVHVLHRRPAAATSSANNGRIFMRLKPRDPAAAGRAGHRRAAAAVRHRARACKRLPQVAPVDPHRRAADQGALPVHAAGRGPPGALPLGAASWTSGSRSCRSLQDVNTDLQLTSPRWSGRTSTATGDHARRDRRPDRERAVHRLRVPAGLHHLRAGQRSTG